MLKTVSGHRKEAIFNNGRKNFAGNALCKICNLTINSIINSFDFWGLWTQIWNQHNLLNGAKSGHKIEMYTSFNLNTIGNFVSSAGKVTWAISWWTECCFCCDSRVFWKKLLKIRYCEKATHFFKNFPVFPFWNYLVKSKQSGIFFQIFAAFPQYLNFTVTFFSNFIWFKKNITKWDLFTRHKKIIFLQHYQLEVFIQGVKNANLAKNC